MKENLSRCLEVVFGAEGGLSLMSSDPGNWTGGKVGEGNLIGTKYGISAAAYPKLDIPNLTLAQATKIYERDYWNVIHGDTLATGVDLAAFDAAVMSGAGTARNWLLRSIGGADD